MKRKLIAKIFNFLRKLVLNYDIRKFNSPPNTDFNITVGEKTFIMQFAHYKISRGIYERINGIREVGTMGVLKSIIKDSDTIIEIGSFYGYFTIVM